MNKLEHQAMTFRYSHPLDGHNEGGYVTFQGPGLQTPGFEDGVKVNDLA